MEQFTLLPWSDRGLLVYSPAILILPYDPITDEMHGEVEKLEPLAIIPPYEPGNWPFNARTAVTTRGWFPNSRVMVALPGSNHYEVRRNMSSLQADGFDAFALPETMGGVSIASMAGFWESSQVLLRDVWYHIAGGSNGPVAKVKGFWSWSEECL